ncbi:MAG: type II 3-dehydroquinate dehydratase [Spirochaetota bacterium]|nr:type II 3-dehydroquinate dehydratase [Spirochaetota bacterium]
MKEILVVHGPNLNLLGSREPEIYGSKTLSDINQELSDLALVHHYQVKSFFSNHEGEIVDFIQDHGEAASGLIINPAAFTHTSVAIRDAILARKLAMIEVHLSNIYTREEFRQRSYFHDIARGVILGLGSKGYSLALEALISILDKE